jgi:hypothetical protein
MPMDVSRQEGGLVANEACKEHSLSTRLGGGHFAIEKAGDNRVSRSQGKVPSLHTTHGILKFLDHIGRKVRRLGG